MNKLSRQYKIEGIKIKMNMNRMVKIIRTVNISIGYQLLVKVDNFSGENMKHAEPLIPILTEECCKMLFSKAWSTKEEGLKWLEN
jgi:CRISPR/Cas system CSM-associated protein Csm5 (group 7 of RAMP superfamily)